MTIGTAYPYSLTSRQNTIIKQTYPVSKKQLRATLLVFLILLTLAKPISGYAAPKTVIDSLKKELVKLPENNARVDILLSISYAYDKVNIDSFTHYGRAAQYLAKKLDYRKGINEANFQLGNIHYSSNAHDSAIYYYTLSLNDAKQENNKSLIAQRYSNIANVYLSKIEYQTALAYYDTAIAYAEEADNLHILAQARNNIGTIYYEKGSYKSALQYYLEGLSTHEELGNVKDIETVLVNLANVYFRLGDHDMAKQYAGRAQKLSDSTGNLWNLISVYNNYSMIFNEEANYDSSLHYQYKAMHLAKDMNSPFLINLLDGNIAELYLEKGMLDSAANLYKRTINVSETLNDIEGVAVGHKGYGQALVAKGDYYKGIKHLETALGILQSKQMREEAMEVAEVLAGAYSKTGNYKKAYDYSLINSKLRDTLAKEAALTAARNMEFETELDKKEARIALLEKDNELKQTRNTNQRIVLIALSSGFILLCVIIYLGYRNLKQTKRKSKLIEEQKKEIQLQAEQLERLNSFKDTTFSVLSHDLRSPINALTITMSMLDEDIIKPEEFREYKTELSNKLQSVSLMLDNMLLWARSQMKGEHTLEIEKVSVKHRTLRAFAVLKDVADQKNIKLEDKISENLFVNADKNQAEMVLRNLVSNAIKFTPEGGTISVSATKDGNMVHISVVDTGVGMPQEIADNLFDGNPNSSKAGTKGEKGTGIGLHLSHTFIQNNNGNISVHSKEGEGTTFIVSLPAA